MDGSLVTVLLDMLKYCLTKGNQSLEDHNGKMTKCGDVCFDRSKWIPKYVIVQQFLELEELLYL